MAQFELPAVDHRLTDSRLHRLFAYWSSLASRAGTRVPPRDLVDPRDMAPLLPHIFLVSAEGDPARFRYRLVGSAIVEFTPGAT